MYGDKTRKKIYMKKKTFQILEHPEIRTLSLILVGGYVFLVIVFYFLAGEQLHLRQSRGEVPMPIADSGTVELTAGNVVEQIFSVKIQRLERLEVQWGTYYRPNAGTVWMELVNLQDGVVLLAQAYDTSLITEGGMTTLAAETPLEGLSGAPLLLRLTSDSVSGSAISPLMYSGEQTENWTLNLNGFPTEGTLCLAVYGTDYIWTGLHYWQFAAVGLALLLGVLAVIIFRFKSGRRSYALNAIAALQKYDFLIRQLVARDFKIKYKRSVLGVFWSFLHPLLIMSVQYVVFSTIFKGDIPNFSVYLLIGVVSFNFFSESCGMALSAILGNYSLITKVYVPKYIYPLTRVMSSVVNLSISLIPLVIMALVTGVRFHKSVFLSLYFFGCLIIFSLGLGLLLSASMVFFRDTQFLWGVLSMIWMYATPIFYPESILPDNFKFVLQINPLYYFLKNLRMCILNGISPEPFAYVQCLMIAMGMLLAGSLVFKKTQDKFILYM